MRLLFLCKRRPQDRDLLTRPYGRFFYLPYHLARQGHDVSLLLLGYSDDPPLHCKAHGMEWYLESLGPLIKNCGPLAYLRRAQMLIQRDKPDWIIGFSDTWYGILAAHLGIKYGINSLIDAYDNYESYLPWAKPLHWVWRSALKKTTAITVAGPQLGGVMGQECGRSPAVVIPMAADPLFQPIIDGNLQKKFGLPEGVPLVGYCGSLFRSRGVDVLFQAMMCLLNEVPNAKLVISGRHEKGLEIPIALRNSVIQLGYLPDEQMPLLLNALDVLVVVNLDSEFGNYSYPVKLYEAMSCHRPVVVTRTASISWILRDHPECIANKGDSEHLARLISDALTNDVTIYINNFDWSYSAFMFEEILKKSQPTMWSIGI
jgi:glycosyltransferase involved in cell wall biosynthesis